MKLDISEWSGAQILEESFLKKLLKVWRLLTKPRNLVCRAAAYGLLHTVGGLVLDRTLFLMSTRMLDYQIFVMDFLKFGTFFQKQNKGCRTLHWLLEQLLIYGWHLDISGVTAPIRSRVLVSSGIMTVRQLVNIMGTDLSVHMGLLSIHVVNKLLYRWRSTLTSEERVQLVDYKTSEMGPAEEGPFPQLGIAPDLGMGVSSWSAGVRRK